MALAILVEEWGRHKSIIWHTAQGELHECDSQLVPSTAFVGSWLSIRFSSGQLSDIILQEHDVDVSLNRRGEVVIHDWCLLPEQRRGWVFSRTLGWTPHHPGFSITQFEPDAAYLLRISWVSLEKRFRVLEQLEQRRAYQNHRQYSQLYYELTEEYQRETGRSFRGEQRNYNSDQDANRRNADAHEWKEEQRKQQEHDDGRTEQKTTFSSFLPSSANSDVDSSEEWLNGVVSGSCQVERGQIFFVATSAGVAVLYPNTLPAHIDTDRIAIGVYAQIRVKPNFGSTKVNCGMKVFDVQFIQRPPDHEIKHIGKKFMILCNCVITERNRKAGGKDWLILRNDFLGVIACPLIGQALSFSVGESCRVSVADESRIENLPKELHCTWLAKDIDVNYPTSKQSDKDVRDSWFEGFVGRCLVEKREQRFMAYVFSRHFNSDLILYGDEEVQDLSGCWISFRVAFNRGTIALRVCDDYRVIDDLYPSRIQSRNPEVRVRCIFHGDRDENGCPLLDSQLGFVCDSRGMIAELGEYDLWICRLFRTQGRSKWTVSLHESTVERIQQESKISEVTMFSSDVLEDAAIRESSNTMPTQSEVEFGNAGTKRSLVVPSHSSDSFDRHSDREEVYVDSCTGEENGNFEKQGGNHYRFNPVIAGRAGIAHLPPYKDSDCERSVTAENVENSRRLEHYNSRSSATEVDSVSDDSTNKETELIRLVRRVIFRSDVRAAILAYDEDVYNGILGLCLADH